MTDSINDVSLFDPPQQTYGLWIGRQRGGLTTFALLKAPPRVYKPRPTHKKMGWPKTAFVCGSPKPPRRHSLGWNLERDV
jgi:hypothetical protein